MDSLCPFFFYHLYSKQILPNQFQNFQTFKLKFVYQHTACIMVQSIEHMLFNTLLMIIIQRDFSRRWSLAPNHLIHHYIQPIGLSVHQENIF